MLRVYPDFLQRCCWNQRGAFCLNLLGDPPQLSTSSQLRPVINICSKGEKEKRGESCPYLKKISILVARAGTLNSVVFSILSCGSHIRRQSLLLHHHHQLLCTLWLLNRAMAEKKTGRGGCCHETWFLSFWEWNCLIQSHRLCTAQLSGRSFPRLSTASLP